MCHLFCQTKSVFIFEVFPKKGDPGSPNHHQRTTAIEGKHILYSYKSRLCPETQFWHVTIFVAIDRWNADWHAVAMLQYCLWGQIYFGRCVALLLKSKTKKGTTEKRKSHPVSQSEEHNFKNKRSVCWLSAQDTASCECPQTATTEMESQHCTFLGKSMNKLE